MFGSTCTTDAPSTAIAAYASGSCLWQALLQCVSMAPCTSAQVNSMPPKVLPLLGLRGDVEDEVHHVWQIKLEAAVVLHLV